MKRFSHILLGAALISAPILSPHAQAAPPVEPAQVRQALASPTRFRASAKCLRNPQCRKSVAERAKKLRDRLDKWIHEFTFGTLQQLHDPTRRRDRRERQQDAIASLDRLESLLQQNGLLSADVKREIEELRAALRQ